MPLDSGRSTNAQPETNVASSGEAAAGAGSSSTQARIAAGLTDISSRLRRATASARSRAPQLEAIGNPYLRRARKAGVLVQAWLAPLERLTRLFTNSLRRRILTANFVGLAILLTGFSVLTFQHTWLIDAKAESLRAQARMFAVALASSAKAETDTMVIDPDRLAEIDSAFPNWRDESLEKLTLEIQPERIGNIMRKLVPNKELRVRIYNRSNVKLHDSDDINSARSERQHVPDPGTEATSEQLRTAWTRLTAWVMRSPLQVYREITPGKVTTYPEVQQALEGHETSILLINDKGEQIISAFAPIKKVNSIPGFVWLTTRPGDLESILWRERRPFFAFSLIGLLATLMASMLLNRTIGGPMKQLAVAAEHVSRNINARQEIPELSGRRDEVGEMARAYRKMTAALYRRIEASDRFAQDVAHELRNPVAAARSTAESLSYANTDQKREEAVRQIQGELKRLNRLIQDVSNASRLDAELALQETEPVNVADVATNITNVFRDIQKGRDDAPPCTVTLTILPADAGPDAFVIDAHEGRLGQVVTNLIDNALSFSPPEGTVAVSVIAEPGEVVIRVDDDGPGIPPNKLDDVFKRFYSDRPQSDRTNAKNSGLGLSISREIVQAHGGEIHAENRPAEPGIAVGTRELPSLAARRIANVAGARFEVRLPRRTAGQRPGFNVASKLRM